LKKGFKIFLLILAPALPSLAVSTYAGSDTACFYDVAHSSCTLTGNTSTLGVSTHGAPLSYSPESGFTAPAAGGTIDLGTFSVSRSLAGAEAGTFDIDITFTAPPGTGGQTFTASTLGLVILGHGGVEITFNDPTTQLFTYPGGSFDLSLPDQTILIGAGHSEDLDATICPLTTTVPEPALLASVGLGLTIFTLLARRRARIRVR
jgi:hypothetical protein